MPKKYDKLWVFGDSYTEPENHVAAEDSFWGVTASYCNIPVIKNLSRRCNSFDSVCHLLTCTQTEINWDKDLIFIGLPPLERITVFDNYADTPYYGKEYNLLDSWQGIDLPSQAHHGLVCLQTYGTDETLIIHHDRSWLETQVLRTIFLLTAWLDSVHANYMILNLSKPLDENNVWGPSEFLLNYVLAHDRCLLFKDTYQSINEGINRPADFAQSGWWGHHEAAGNKYFFDKSLLPAMIKANLV